MSCGVTIQHARLLSDILEDTTPDLNVFKPVGDELFPTSFSAANKLFQDDVDQRGKKVNSLSIPLLLSEDPDTESDEHEFLDSYDTSSPTSWTSVTSSDDEGSDRRGKKCDDDLLRKGSVDERACSRLLQNKINAVLDRIALDTATNAILERCATLPSELKAELLWRSITRKSITDGMLHCFLTTRASSDNVKEMDRPSDFALRLQRLSLFECQNITDAGLRTLSRCCPSLQSLDLTRCRCITPLGLQDIIRSCPLLTDLFLCECPALCDKTIPTVFRYNNPPHIRCLSVRRCDLHDYGLSALASYCPTLQKLDVRCCGLLTAAGFYALMQRVPTISMLSCGRCIGTDDTALRYIGQGFGASLTDLNLSMCWKISSRGVTELARNCRRLRSLNLSSCTLVDDSALKAICRNPFLQQSLVCINLNDCNVGDDALEELVANCQSLSLVSVVGCPRVTYDRALRLAHLAGIQIIM